MIVKEIFLLILYTIIRHITRNRKTFILRKTGNGDFFAVKNVLFIAQFYYCFFTDNRC
jgi:hypothetical protein